MRAVRLFDGRLYVLNSGAGEVLRVDPDARTSERLAVLPGFTRGLRRHGNVLFVGLSTLRASAIALDLPLAARGDTLFSGIAALDLETGRVLGMMRLAPEVAELFDFVVMPGIHRALVFDPVFDAPITAVETPDSSFLMGGGPDPAHARPAAGRRRGKQPNGHRSRLRGVYPGKAVCVERRSITLARRDAGGLERGSQRQCSSRRGGMDRNPYATCQNWWRLWPKTRACAAPGSTTNWRSGLGSLA